MVCPTKGPIASMPDESSNNGASKTVTTWGGCTGEVYICGKLTNGKLQQQLSLRGKKIRQISGKKNQILILYDNWEFWWTPKDSQQDEVSKSLENVKIQMVSFGRMHATSLSLDGNIFTWGSNAAFGQLGLYNKLKPVNSFISPTQINHTAVFKEVCCGAFHNAAIDSTGSLYTWGRGIEGQTGHSSKSSSIKSNKLLFGFQPIPKFVRMFLGKKARKVACGEKFTCVLLENGEVWSFGEAQCGQLGQGRQTQQMIPTLTTAYGPEKSAFIDISCGWAHTVALTENGDAMAWGFNLHGQLGLGDERTRYYPEKISGNKFRQVSAGGNFSAGINEVGELFTWGIGVHCCLGNDYIQKRSSPEIVSELVPRYITNVKCFADNFIVFEPTWISQISPTCGPISGGTEILINGSGFWNSDNITVRFAPIGEGRLPRASLGSYNESSRQVLCTSPKCALPGDVTVEISMNGKYFTTNSHIFHFYAPLSFTQVSLVECRSNIAEEFFIFIKESIPSCCNNIYVRFIDSSKNIIASSQCNFIEHVISRPGKNSEEPDEVLETVTKVQCQTPVIESVDLITCHLEYSLNGKDFSVIKIPCDEKNKAHKIYVHEAKLQAIKPNSFLIDSIAIQDSRVELIGCHLFNLSQTKVRFKYEYVEVNENDTNLKTCIIAFGEVVDQSTNHISCIIPSLDKWALEAQGDAIISSEDELSEDESKQSEELDEVNAEQWYSKLSQFHVTVDVSLNGCESYLPYVKNTIYINTLGKQSAISPQLGPISGETIVQLFADSLYFDTTDAVLKVEYNDISYCSNGSCLKGPASADKASDEEECKTSKECQRVITAKMPSFEVFLGKKEVIENNCEDVELLVNSNKEEDSEVVVNPREAKVFFSLNGRDFSDDSISFSYYDEPILKSLSPSEVSPGTLVEVCGEGLINSHIAKVRLCTANYAEVAEVEATIKENLNSLTFVVPDMDKCFVGELIVGIALNGIQFSPNEVPLQYFRIDEEGVA